MFYHIFSFQNKSLKLEKQKYMKEAIRKAKEQEVEMQKRTEVTYEEVEAALKEKLAAARVEEEQVKGIGLRHGSCV